MVFTTHLFLFYYLSAFLVIYYALPFRARTGLIVVGSYLFYGWANPLWPLLMFLSSGVDYVCGRVLLALAKLPATDGLPAVLPKGERRTRGQTATLWVSILSNLGLLAYFKYAGFAVENLNALSEVLGQGASLVPALQVALPVGISFYTFKSMSYAIDVYRGDARPMVSFVNFCCFEAFFPDLVAGPIVRYAAIERQMRERTHTADKFARGVVFFALGMAKKILIANPMAQVADAAFDAGGLHWYDAWYGVVGYAFQIYFDFSGYSDMANGLALMMGFVLLQNFNAPYQSESLTEVWRRWHISVSTWLRDYLYIPLGGNRKGSVRTYVNLWLVMLIGGIWHGASWNFVIWGAIHGGLLAVERVNGQRALYSGLSRPWRVGITFGIVCIAWVFFRAETLSQALGYVSSLFGMGRTTIASDAVAALMYTNYHMIVVMVAAILVWRSPTSWVFSRRITWARAAYAAALLLLSTAFMWTQSENPFIYFRF